MSIKLLFDLNELEQLVQFTATLSLLHSLPSVFVTLSLVFSFLQAHLLQVQDFVLHFLECPQQLSLSQPRLLQLSLQAAHKLLRVLKQTSQVLDMFADADHHPTSSCRLDVGMSL